MYVHENKHTFLVLDIEFITLGGRLLMPPIIASYLEHNFNRIATSNQCV